MRFNWRPFVHKVKDQEYDMKTRFYIYLAAALLGLAQQSARAEDIDLFTIGASSTQASNLLIVIDNAANFSANTTISGSTCTIGGATNTLSGTVGGVEQCVLYSVINSLPATSATASINIGIMMYNAANIVNYLGTACNSSGTGGCLVFPMTALTTANKATLLTYIASWKTSNGGAGSRWVKANNAATGAAMQEAWAYYAGRTGLSGTNYSNNGLLVNCKNFLLFISSATNMASSPGDSGNASQAPKNALEGTNPTTAMNADPAASITQKAIISSSSTDQITACGTLTSMPTNHNNAGFYADEWARYMKGSTLAITSYTAALVLPGSCKPEVPWLMNSIASYGGGKYFPTTDSSSLATALETVVSEVRSVNSVFAAVSLPVSVNAQGTYLNQVFVGMFRPQSDSAPRWFGNLKQYKLGYLTGSRVLRMLDADENAAISSSGSEFVGVCARSYWTPSKSTTGDGYWSTYTPDSANCAGYPAASNSPDGNLVEKGGQGYMLRKTTPSARTVKTCATTFSSCTTLTDFTTSNTALTTTTFGVTTTTERDTLVNWVRGANNHSPGEVASLDGGATVITSSDMRPSAHGDVVHSRPAALNFGTDASPKVVVFYGTNDGVFRAINGNRTASFTVGSTPVAAGDEFWGFVAPELYGRMKRLYDNSPAISSTNTKGYSLDGPVAASKATNGDGLIYVGMRRGGRALYAFGMDKTTFATTLKWKRGCGDSTTTNCTNDTNGDFRNIGQTWAPPQAFTAQATGSTPLLIMGGGYDATCEDTISYGTCATPIGNRIYVMNADTGVLSKTFTTTRGVIGDVTIVPDSNGYASYIYAVDLAGDVWRISGPLSGGAYTPIGTNAASAWIITQVATLGCGSGTTVTTISTCTSPPNRKLMFAPDVVVDGSTYYIAVGSGDREKPTNTSNATSNHFFTIKDRPDLGSSYLADTTNCGVGATKLCLNSLLAIAKTVSPTTADLAAKKGWYLALDANEQVVNAAVSIFGKISFNTHTPQVASSNSCSVNLGTLRSYSISYTNAAGSDTPIVRLDGGLAPDPVAGKVKLDDGSIVPFCIGCIGPLEASQPTSTSSTSNPAKIRSYWFLQK